MKNLLFFDWTFVSDTTMGLIVFLIVIAGIVLAVEANKDEDNSNNCGGYGDDDDGLYW